MKSFLSDPLLLLLEDHFRSQRCLTTFALQLLSLIQLIKEMNNFRACLYEIPNPPPLLFNGSFEDHWSAKCRSMTIAIDSLNEALYRRRRAPINHRFKCWIRFPFKEEWLWILIICEAFPRFFFWPWPRSFAATAVDRHSGRLHILCCVLCDTGVTLLRIEWMTDWHHISRLH